MRQAPVCRGVSVEHGGWWTADGRTDGRPAEGGGEAAGPRGLAQPPTITLRRPSRTCMAADGRPKCSEVGAPPSPDGQTSLICFCGFYSEKPAEGGASLGRGRKVMSDS